MPVLIVGPTTGPLGRRVTRALLDRGVEVRVLPPGQGAPSEPGAPGRPGAPDGPGTPGGPDWLGASGGPGGLGASGGAVPVGVRVVEGDLRDPQALRAQAEGCRAVLVLPGPVVGQVQAQNEAVDLAADLGARVVKVSRWGPAVREDSADPGARRDWINQQYLRSRGLPYTVLSPNHSMQQLVDRHAESVRRSGVLPDPAGGQGVSLVDLGDVAEAVVRVLTEEGHEGRGYVLSGPSAPTYPEIARLLTGLTGREVVCRALPADAGDTPEPAQDSRRGQVTDALPLLLRRAPRDIEAFLRAGIRHFVPDPS